MYHHKSSAGYGVSAKLRIYSYILDHHSCQSLWEGSLRCHDSPSNNGILNKR